MQLFAKHPTGLEIQHALVSSAAGGKRDEEEAVNVTLSASFLELWSTEHKGNLI